MEVEMRNYMRWKAATTQLVLERINPESDKEPLVYDELLNDLGDIILNGVKPFMTSNDLNSCCRNLRGTLRSAIKLDGKINQQLARHVPQYTWTGSRTPFLHDFPFDDRIMGLAQGQPVPDHEAKVQMVLTPALVRYGSLEGEKYENFEKPDVLVHAVVHLQSSSGFHRAKVTKSPPDNWDEGQSYSGERSSGNRGGGRSRR
jgi:hypothetical protein